MYLLIIRSTTSKLAIPLTVAVKDWFELAECEESTCAGDTEIAFGLVEAICGALQVATACQSLLSTAGRCKDYLDPGKPSRKRRLDRLK